MNAQTKAAFTNMLEATSRVSSKRFAKWNDACLAKTVGRANETEVNDALHEYREAMAAQLMLEVTFTEVETADERANRVAAEMLGRLQNKWDEAEAAYLDARLNHSPQLDRFRDKCHEARAAYRAARMMAKELGAL